VKYLDADDALLRDVIEMADIPCIVIQTTFAAAQDAVDARLELIPEGVLNAPPLIAEINDRIGACKTGDMPHVIKLTLLPRMAQPINRRDLLRGRFPGEP